MADKFSRGTAFHEAGHAVVAWALGFTIKAVVIDAGDDSGRTVLGETEAPWRDDITILAAGYTAENLFRCWGPEQAAAHDHGRIASALGRVGIDPEPKAGPRQDADDRALAILRANERGVLKLVGRLVASGHIDGDEFLRLIGGD